MKLNLLALILLLGAVAAPSLLAQSNQVAVVNAASFQARWPVAPGGLASAFGTFTGATQGSPTMVPLPTSINGVELRVNGVAAPLLFVSATQINFQVPAATPITVTSLTTTVTVEVRVGGSVVASGTMAVAPASPAMFVADLADPLAPGAILNQQSQFVAVRRGEVIQIFATGAGTDLSSPVIDGTAAGSAPLVDTTKKPRVFIFQQEATVEFSGLSPEFVGLWQINVKVPENASVSGTVPVQIFYDGLLSNVVTINVLP
ncbi:MAG: hypothetical protein U5J83_18370 [Bryobacterales bacterium]|nr:hypothetical protein [Bryobacterales bacterium]